MIKTSPKNLPSLIKVLKNVISYDILDAIYADGFHVQFQALSC